MSCGGLGETKAVTEEVKEICEQIRSKFETDLGRTFSVFEAKSFKSQIVAGVNYFVKVHVGNDEYIHLRIYKPLPHTGQPPSVASHQLGKKLENEIEYFEQA